MSTLAAVETGLDSTLSAGAWRIDPARSSVEFHVRHFYGLMTVKGAPGTLIVRGHLVREEGV